MSAAARMKRTRARRKAGRRVLAVEVDEITLEAILIELRHLRPEQADDPTQVEAALSRMLERLCEAYERCA